MAGFGCPQGWSDCPLWTARSISVLSEKILLPGPNGSGHDREIAFEVLSGLWSPLNRRVFRVTWLGSVLVTNRRGNTGVDPVLDVAHD